MEIKYQLNEKDFERLAVQTFKSQSSRWLWINRIMLPTIMILIDMANAYIKYGGIKLSVPAIMESALFGVGAVILGELIFYWYGKRKGRMIARGSEPNVYKEFGEIKVVLTNYNKLRVAWEGGVLKISKPFYKGMRETKDILVYNGGEEDILIVPKRVFQTEEDQTKFKEMISKFILEED